MYKRNGGKANGRNIRNRRLYIASISQSDNVSGHHNTIDHGRAHQSMLFSSIRLFSFLSFLFPFVFIPPSFLTWLFPFESLFGSLFFSPKLSSGGGPLREKAEPFWRYKTSCFFIFVEGEREERNEDILLICDSNICVLTRRGASLYTYIYLSTWLALLEIYIYVYMYCR